MEGGMGGEDGWWLGRRGWQAKRGWKLRRMEGEEEGEAVVRG